jgi:Mg-chelatase subunit ChlI
VHQQQQQYPKENSALISALQQRFDQLRGYEELLIAGVRVFLTWSLRNSSIAVELERARPAATAETQQSKNAKHRRAATDMTTSSSAQHSDATTASSQTPFSSNSSSALSDDHQAAEQTEATQRQRHQELLEQERQQKLQIALRRFREETTVRFELRLVIFFEYDQ